jgi:phage-related minor tail protein
MEPVEMFVVAVVAAVVAAVAAVAVVTAATAAAEFDRRGEKAESPRKSTARECAITRRLSGETTFCTRMHVRG